MKKRKVYRYGPRKIGFGYAMGGYGPYYYRERIKEEPPRVKEEYGK
jgi:hypothetical protein